MVSMDGDGGALMGNNAPPVSIPGNHTTLSYVTEFKWSKA
jgi:hypothetical protein